MLNGSSVEFLWQSLISWEEDELKVFLSNPISKLNIRCRYQPGRLIRRLVFIQVQALCSSLWEFLFFKVSTSLPFTFFTFPVFIFPPFPHRLSVSDFLSLLPYLPAPSPFAPFTPSPSFPPSFPLCHRKGGWASCFILLHSDHFSSLSHLGQPVALPAGQQTPAHTHTFTAFSTGQPGRLPHSQVFDTHTHKRKSFSSFLFSSRFIDAHAEQLTALLSFMQDFLFPFHVFSFCYLAQTVHTLLARMRTCSLMSVQMLFDLV